MLFRRSGACQHFRKLPQMMHSSIPRLRVAAWFPGLLGAFCMAQAESLTVGAGQTVHLGDPERPVSRPYDSLTVLDGGVLVLDGALTLNVAGDVRISGQILSKPKGKQAAGAAGAGGAAGVDQAPPVQRAGGGGILGDRGADWATPGARLDLRSQGTVVIAGTVDLRPEREGGDGGQGGHGGRGGHGPQNDSGGFGGQAGSGNGGGHGQLSGANVRITGRRVELLASGRILLDNLSKGGRGGPGGNGGDGGNAGNSSQGPGSPGGGGGPAGEGGDGGLGGSGGILTIGADTARIEGLISLQGADGGPGGPAGTPGKGGNGGAGATDPPSRGGRGGDAGNVNGSGPRGGRGGPGGNGGSLVLDVRGELVMTSRPQLRGGHGGAGGEGRPGSLSRGGTGGAGSPVGESGLSSGVLLQGLAGPDGRDGLISRWTGFVPGPIWQGPPFDDCGGPFVETDGTGVTRRGLELCEGDCTSTSFTTSAGTPIELQLEHRWVSTSGALVLRLGGRVLHRVEAGGGSPAGFQQVRVFVSDAALHSPSAQTLELCAEGRGARVRIANLVVRNAPEVHVPVLTVVLPEPPATDLRFSWDSRNGHTYQLESRPPGGAGAWSAVGGLRPGTGADLTATVPLAAGSAGAYFRVVSAAAQ